MSQQAVAYGAFPAAPWWRTAPGRGRSPYVFLAFAPGYTEGRIVALAQSTLSGSGCWNPSPEVGRAAREGLHSWRHTSGRAVLSLFLAGHYPLIAVMAPGDPDSGPAQAQAQSQAQRTGIPAGRAVRLAVRRFERAAWSQGARTIVTAQLTALVAASAALAARGCVIRGRLAEIADADRVRNCPRCQAGCDPALRWCPRCEYEFTHADDHVRDQRALQRGREAEGLRRMLAELAAQSFPAAAFAPYAVNPAPGWAGPR